MIPNLSESTLNALVMGCDASEEYGPVVRTLVAALRSESARASQLADALTGLLSVAHSTSADGSFTVTGAAIGKARDALVASGLPGITP